MWANAAAEAAESGTHESLLRAGGHYAALVALQTRGLLAA